MADNDSSAPATEASAGEQSRTPTRHAWPSAAALIGVLIAILGFAIVVQVRQNSREDSLSGLREDDLIGILDNQNNRAERLRQQLTELQTTLRQLQDSGDRNAAAQRQAKAQARALGILLGTSPATGPGVVITVTDPDRALHAEDLLDIVQELRGAGAEAIQVGTVRVSTPTAFTDAGGAVSAAGVRLVAPYRILAIGDATTLDTALNIPGGVAAAVRAVGGTLTVHERTKITILATRTPAKPRYAKPTR